MLLGKSDSHRELRALLILGRVSNLPTVWSNCLAGWLLGGEGTLGGFAILGLGATCLYVGGMFLNDAFDVEFDRQHRKERPIPSGAIPLEKVWIWGISWLAAGALCLIPLGKSTALLTLLLIGSIILYDAIHKMLALSPLLMALCRILLYLVAASAAAEGVTGLTIWSALVLGAYIVGLSCLARRESARGPLRFWPCYLLAAPIVLALIVNNGEYRVRGFLLSVIFAAWVARCLRHVLWTTEPKIGLAVSGLLAGIVFVDLVAVGGGTPLIGACFLMLFASAVLFQRYVPAT